MKNVFHRIAVWSLLSAISLTTLGWTLYGSGGHDDSHITYWPAYTLSHFGEIVNYNGDFLEQSSSLLQVLSISLFHSITGVGIVTSGYLTSILFGILCLPLVYVLSRHFCTQAAPYSTLITATSGSFVYWSFGGLESALAAFCILWFLISVSSTSRKPSSLLRWSNITLSTIALVSVRPEMPIVVVCILLGSSLICYFLYCEKRLHFLILISLVSFSVIIFLFTFKIYYFGSVFPLPVYSKSSLSIGRIWDGLYYIYEMIRYPGGLRFIVTPFSIFMIASLISYSSHCFKILKGEVRSFASYLLVSYFFAYVSFIILSGGDWMAAGRFLVPVIPVASIFISVEAHAHASTRSAFVTMVLPVILFNLLWCVNIQLSGQSAGVSVLNRHEYKKNIYENSLENLSWFEKYSKIHSKNLKYINYSYDLVEKILKVDDKVVISTAQMGIFPYHISKKYFGYVEIIDQCNLATKKIDKKLPERLETTNTFGSCYTYSDIFNKSNESNIGDEIEMVYTLWDKKVSSLTKRGFELYVKSSRANILFDEKYCKLSELRRYCEKNEKRTDKPKKYGQ